MIPGAHFDSLTATSLEPPKNSSAYLSGYASGFFVVFASFRENSRNAHDGAIFHNPLAVSRCPTGGLVRSHPLTPNGSL